MKRYRVEIVDDAERDLKDILLYICEHDSPERAAYVLDQLEASWRSLEQFPGPGHIPPELQRVGVTDYREIHFKPYRLVYQVRGTTVYLHCVLDGRRDLQAELSRRLLRR